MALPSPTAVDDWTAPIREGAVAFMNARVNIVKLGAGERYDPLTDTGGTTGRMTVLADRRARVQHISKPTETSNSGAWETKQRYTVQIELQPGDDEVLKGHEVDILDGGQNPHLAGRTLQVLKASGSSFLPLVSIDCVDA